MKNRIFLTIIVVSLILNSICVSATQSDKTDWESEIYEEAYELTEVIKPVSQIFGSEETVTRAEFIAAVVNILNYEFKGNSVPEYTDIDKDDELYNVLSVALDKALISVDDTFRPDDAITLQECVTIGIRALGYEYMVDLYGGYLNTAKRIGLFENINGTEITKKNAYIIIYNMLHTDMLAISSIHVGNNGTSSSYDGSLTMLETVYGIYNTEGVMTANNYTAKGDDTDEGEKNRIVIDGIKYDGGKEFNDYLGYNVTAYYKADKNSDKKQLVYVKAKDNRIVTADAADACAEILSDRSIELTIESDNKSREYHTKRAVDVLYNGKFTYSYTQAELNPSSGNITLIDNDGDGRYDVYKIDSFYYITDARVSLVEESIADGRETGKKLVLADTDYFIKDLQSRENVELSAIDEGSVLAVKKSKDGLLNEVFVCSETIKGNVQNYNSTKKKIVVNNTAYRLSGYFASKYNSNTLFKEDLIFCIGVNGEIVCICQAETSYQYGYVVGVKDAKGLAEKAQMKIFTQNGEMKIFDVADKFYVDEVKKDTTSISASVTTQQLVRFLLNSKGKLARVDTADATDRFVDEDTAETHNSLTKYTRDTDDSTGLYYRTNTRCFYPKFNITKAVIFAIPEDRNSHEDYYIASSSWFTNKRYDVYPYDIHSDGCARAVVYNYKSNDLLYASNTSAVMIVEEVVDALSPDGEVVKEVYGWSGGKFVDYYLGKSVVISKASGNHELVGGDIVRYNARGDQIEHLIVEFDAAVFARNDIEGVRTFNQNANGFQYQSGKVYSKSNDYIYISSVKDALGRYDFGFENLRLFRINEAKFVVYEMSAAREKKLRPGYLSDIVTSVEAGEDAASFVVLQQENLYTYSVFIYK